METNENYWYYTVNHCSLLATIGNYVLATIGQKEHLGTFLLASLQWGGDYNLDQPTWWDHFDSLHTCSGLPYFTLNGQFNR